ncbi:hypothetical protein PENTCL1PPCAC_14754, partial [Pristionchus entomophagus]
SSDIYHEVFLRLHSNSSKGAVTMNQWRKVYTVSVEYGDIAAVVVDVQQLQHPLTRSTSCLQPRRRRPRGTRPYARTCSRPCTSPLQFRVPWTWRRYRPCSTHRRRRESNTCTGRNCRSLQAWLMSEEVAKKGSELISRGCLPFHPLLFYTHPHWLRRSTTQPRERRETRVCREGRET